MLDEAETKGWRAEKGEGKRNRGESREKREKAPLGEARLSEEEEREMQPGASVKLWPNRVRWQSVRERRTVGSLPAQKFRDAQGLANRCAHVRR